MTDRVLTEEEVTRAEREAEDLLFLGSHVTELCASHRLQAARIQGLEGQIGDCSGPCRADRDIK